MSCSLPWFNPSFLRNIETIGNELCISYCQNNECKTVKRAGRSNHFAAAWPVTSIRIEDWGDIPSGRLSTQIRIVGWGNSRGRLWWSAWQIWTATRQARFLCWRKTSFFLAPLMSLTTPLNDFAGSVYYIKNRTPLFIGRPRTQPQGSGSPFF